MARYQLKDDGYASFQWIVRGKDRVGRVHRNADGSFIGIIGRVQAPGSSWEDAKNQVVAEVEGIPIPELNHELVSVTPIQQHTQAILTWLTNQAESNGGRLHFTNTDLADAAGWQGPNQALGQLVSRLDLCCYKANLPSIGCAAEATFPNAWKPRPTRSFVFPKEIMVRRAKAHRWTRSDFERIGRESRALMIGSGRVAWDDEFAKHEARIKEWAYQEAA